MKRHGVVKVSIPIFTSRVSGWGDRISLVFPSFRLSVHQRSYGQTAWHMDTKFHIGIDLEKISDKFDGQGQRSRSRSQKMWFSGFSNLSDPIWNLGQWCESWCVTSQNGVMTLNNVSMAKMTMIYTWEKRQRWGVFILNILLQARHIRGRSVIPGAFSYWILLQARELGLQGKSPPTVPLLKPIICRGSDNGWMMDPGMGVKYWTMSWINYFCLQAPIKFWLRDV